MDCRSWITNWIEEVSKSVLQHRMRHMVKPNQQRHFCLNMDCSWLCAAWQGMAKWMKITAPGNGSFLGFVNFRIKRTGKKSKLLRYGTSTPNAASIRHWSHTTTDCYLLQVRVMGRQILRTCFHFTAFNPSTRLQSASSTDKPLQKFPAQAKGFRDSYNSRGS